MKKYEILEHDFIEVGSVKLYRIRALRDFGDVEKGDVGGFIEKEANLSQDGDCWVYGDAQVSGEARVYGDAKVYGGAEIKSNNDHCGFDCFGSANRHTHAYRTKDGGVEITCGCFKGSIEDFEKQVEKTHAGTIYEKQYKAMIEMIKLKF